MLHRLYRKLLQTTTNPILTKKGVREGNTSSPEVFTNNFKKFCLDQMGIIINEGGLNNLSYVSDIIINIEKRE